MVRLLALPVVAALLALSVCPQRADAGVINGNFSGGLSGWTALGNASVAGSQAWIQTRSGLNRNQLSAGLGVDFSGLNINHGSALSQALKLGDGDSLSFDWNFLTNEGSGRGVSRDDIAFWGLLDGETGVEVLTSAFQSSELSSSDSAFGSETGLNSYVSQSLSAGNYTLVFGVANVGNNSNHSALLISNVSVISGASVVADPLVQQTIVNPEPASIAVWGLGLVGVAVGSFRRRRRQTSLQPA